MKQWLVKLTLGPYSTEKHAEAAQIAVMDSSSVISSHKAWIGSEDRITVVATLKVAGDTAPEAMDVAVEVLRTIGGGDVDEILGMDVSVASMGPSVGQWYPVPPPARTGEGQVSYTERMLGRNGHVSPFDHERNRQCALGFHNECSDKTGVTCRCPHHREPELPGSPHPGATILAELWYLPLGSADKIMALASRLAKITPPDGLRKAVADELSSTYRSIVRRSDGMVEDIVKLIHELSVTGQF